MRSHLNFTLALILFLLCAPMGAWNDIGHSVVAQIAWSSLTPKAQNKALQILKGMPSTIRTGNTFIDASVWPDKIKDSFWNAFDNWHYVSLPMSQPPNVVWALCQCVNTLKDRPQSNFSPGAENPKVGKAFMARMLIHLVGDIHQPLHCASQENPDMPGTDDKGGNLFPVVFSQIPTNLHLIWDFGLGMFGSPGQSKTRKMPMRQVRRFASAYKREFPKSYFKDKIQIVSFKTWAEDSHQIAKEFVYNTARSAELDKTYIVDGQRIVRERVALAGYRLAEVLEQLLSRSKVPDYECN